MLLASATDYPFIAIVPERINVLRILTANGALQRCGILSASHYRRGAV